MTTDPSITNQPVSKNSEPAVRSRFLPIAMWVLASAFIATFLVDQISKEIALHALVSGPRTVAGVQFHLVANRGIVMGIPAPTAFIVLATVAVLVVALRSAMQSRWTMTLAYGLLAGGALGNLADRFQDRHGFPTGAVVDWISAGRMTFNLADVFLITGVLLLFFLPVTRDVE